MVVQPGAPSTPGASVKRPPEINTDSLGAKRVKLDTGTEGDIATRDTPCVAIPDGSADIAQAQRGGRPKSKRGRGEPRDRRRGTRTEESERQSSDEPKAPRLPKKACALLIGFSGAGYSGMQ